MKFKNFEFDESGQILIIFELKRADCGLKSQFPVSREHMKLNKDAYKMTFAKKLKHKTMKKNAKIPKTVPRTVK